MPANLENSAVATGLERGSFYFNPKKGNTKECSNKIIPEKHLLLLHWLRQSFWLCRSPQIVKNSSRDGNTRTPYLPPVKPYAGQEAIVRTGHGTTDWFQIGKGVRQGCILSPCLFNLYTECIKQNARLDEAQDCREKYQQPQICRWHHPYGRKWRRTKESLDESERREWKSWLKTQHSKN